MSRLVVNIVAMVLGMGIGLGLACEIMKKIDISGLIQPKEKERK